MKSCIYAIVNLQVKEIYIGSAENIDTRIRQHLSLLKRNIHHSYKLQKDFNKYGENNFIFHIIEFCSKENLQKYEQIYIENLKPYYNISKDSTSPMRGRNHSEKTLNKLKGRTPWNKGIPRTEEEKELMSFIKKQNNKKRPKNYFKELAKTRKHLKPFKNKHHTQETKLKLRNARKSKKLILCVNTGKIYEAQLDAAKDLNIKQGHISECLNGKRSSVKGYKFKYVD